MSAILTIDSAGRIVVPKRIREKLHLATGTKLRADIVGDKLELEVERLEATVVRNKSGRRVIVGWEKSFIPKLPARGGRNWTDGTRLALSKFLLASMLKVVLPS